MSNFTIGIALGGGGARGAAHIGVLQVLQENNLQPDYIGGTSAGAVIGAMYAATRDPVWIENRFREFMASETFRHLGTEKMRSNRHSRSPFGQVAKFVQDKVVVALALSRTSIIERKRLENTIRFLLPVGTFEDLQIPTSIIATNFHTGEVVEYTSGDLVEALVQSSSIPGFVPPTAIDDKLLLDGGASMPIPVPIVKSRVNFTIAIDISRGRPEPMQKLNMLEIMSRSERITSQHLCNTIVKEADFILRPDVKGLHWSQFDRFDELLEAGRKEAGQQLDDLNAALRKYQSLGFRVKQWIGLEP